MKVTVKTQGFKELEKSLFLLKQSTAKAVVRGGMRDAIEPAARLARQKAPVGEGDLYESIDVSTRAKPAARKQSDLEIYMGPGRNPQAITQEFGTFKEPAQPYMRPAWDAEKEKTLERFGVFLWERVQKALAKVGK